MLQILTKQQREAILYSWHHRKAFRAVELLVRGKHTWRSLFHDIDKIVLYAILPIETVHNMHVKLWPHHNPSTAEDYKQMLIDWECARFTKPDKPLNAYDTLYKWYPQLEPVMLPLLKKYHLDGHTNWLDDARIWTHIQRAAGVI